MHWYLYLIHGVNEKKEQGKIGWYLSTPTTPAGWRRRPTILNNLKGGKEFKKEEEKKKTFFSSSVSNGRRQYRTKHGPAARRGRVGKMLVPPL